MADAPDTRPVVFISYARADSNDFVDRLEQDLLKHALHPRVDRRCLESGQEWVDMLQDAIDQCQAVVVVLSPAAAQSKYVKQEYRYAAMDKLIIPVLYQPTPGIPMDLHSLQRADFLASYEEGLHQLLHSLSRFQAMNDPSCPQCHALIFPGRKGSGIYNSLASSCTSMAAAPSRSIMKSSSKMPVSKPPKVLKML